MTPAPRRSRGRRLVVPLALLAASCARWGFELAPAAQVVDGSSGGDGLPPSDGKQAIGDGVPSSDGRGAADSAADADAVTSSRGGAMDRCEPGQGVDLSGGPVTLQLDFSSATNDYDLPCCQGRPEMIVRVDGAVDSLAVSCSGAPGAMFSPVMPTQAERCPPAGVDCPTFSCSGVTASTSVPQGTIYVALCATAGARVDVVLSRP